MISNEHEPVLLAEVFEALNVRADGVYVDCTFGRGGHSSRIAQGIGSSGRLLTFDKDPAAIAYAQKWFAEDSRVICLHGSFTKLHDEIESRGLLKDVDGLLFDLGVSSPQLDDARYGFSFTQDGDMDMRMDPSSNISAAEWLNHAKKDDIFKVLREYGEERYARRIAIAIVKFRKKKLITRTRQLADIVAASVPSREQKKHPATRTFQAIRIFVNDELEELKNVLAQVHDVLAPGGRLVVISFHSLEDRIVKRFLQQAARGDDFPPEIPVMANELSPKIKIIGRAIKPTNDEILRNPRARSAVLRVGEKITS